MPLVTRLQLGIKALQCTDCSGCKDCRQPVPLVIPEGTGGSGCSAEVAAKAEALHQAGTMQPVTSMVMASSSRARVREQQARQTNSIQHQGHKLTSTLVSH
jgi:hypothetical protein